MEVVGKGLIGAVVSMLTGGSDKSPTPEKPKTAPNPDDKTSQRNRERMMARQRAGQGRAGTMLTDGNNTLG